MKLAACLLPLFVLIQHTLANTEKVIFSAPPTETLSELYDLKEEVFQIINTANPSLRASLPVSFPTIDRPKGLDSWYRLERLEEGRRYEVRVCWAATVCSPSTRVPTLSNAVCSNRQPSLWTFSHQATVLEPYY